MGQDYSHLPKGIIKTELSSSIADGFHYQNGSIRDELIREQGVIALEDSPELAENYEFLQNACVELGIPTIPCYWEPQEIEIYADIPHEHVHIFLSGPVDSLSVEQRNALLRHELEHGFTGEYDHAMRITQLFVGPSENEAVIGAANSNGIFSSSATGQELIRMARNGATIEEKRPVAERLFKILSHEREYHCDLAAALATSPEAVISLLQDLAMHTANIDADMAPDELEQRYGKPMPELVGNVEAIYEYIMDRENIEHPSKNDRISKMQQLAREMERPGWVQRVETARDAVQRDIDLST